MMVDIIAVKQAIHTGELELYIQKAVSGKNCNEVEEWVMLRDTVTGEVARLGVFRGDGNERIE